MKIPINYDEQIEYLKELGFEINDIEKAKKYLKHIGYNRLSHYFNYFLENHNGEEKNFNTIINYYIFDRKLKLMLIDLIERIEISFKANIIDVLSLKYSDVYFFMKNEIYINNDEFNNSISLLTEKKDFNKNLKKIDLSKIESWKLFHGLSLSTIIEFYNKISTENQKEIANIYNLQNLTLGNWILGLLDVRNICAHYDKLWGRKMPKPLLFTHKKLKVFKTNNDSLFSYILILNILIHRIGIESHFLDKLELLFNEDEYKNINKKIMGFEDDWKQIIQDLLLI